MLYKIQIISCISKFPSPFRHEKVSLTSISFPGVTVKSNKKAHKCSDSLSIYLVGGSSSHSLNFQLLYGQLELQIGV